ncbi:hypothetical protein DDSR119_26a [Pseudomonas phage DDSR119]
MKLSSWLTGLFIATCALMMTACASPTPPKTGLQSNLLLECATPPDITETTGKAAQEALTAWGMAFNECKKLNSSKAAHIRSIHGVSD